VIVLYCKDGQNVFRQFQKTKTTSSQYDKIAVGFADFHSCISSHGCSALMS
jgi:hypothetical protein